MLFNDPKLTELRELAAECVCAQFEVDYEAGTATADFLATGISDSLDGYFESPDLRHMVEFLNRPCVDVGTVEIWDVSIYRRAAIKFYQDGKLPLVERRMASQLHDA